MGALQDPFRVSPYRNPSPAREAAPVEPSPPPAAAPVTVAGRWPQAPGPARIVVPVRKPPYGSPGQRGVPLAHRVARPFGGYPYLDPPDGQLCGSNNPARPRSSHAHTVDLVDRLQRLGGAALWRDLAASRRDRRELARLVDAGVIVVLPGHCYALPGADMDVVRARQHDARLTCISAARAHDLALLTTSPATHLAVPHSHGPDRAATRRDPHAVIHREQPALLTAEPHPGVPGGEGVLVVTVSEALARMLRCQDSMSAIVAVDSALNRHLCTVRDVEALLIGPGSAAPRAALRECDGRSMSPAESIARVTLNRGGLAVEPGVFIEGVGFVDLLVAGRLVVELDGYAYHSSHRQFGDDRRRDRDLLAQGYLVLRFTWEDVATNPDALLAAVLAALARW